MAAEMIHDVMPEGYRYATAEECERWDEIPDVAQLRAPGAPASEEWADIIVPGCKDCEPCLDGEHATVEDGRCTCCGQEVPECPGCGRPDGATNGASACATCGAPL